jgi:2-methylcitrate dehydratase PrpD
MTAAIFVQSGFTGVDDVLEGEQNFLDTYSPSPKPQELVDGLGTRYEIMATSIKRFPVGAPIQAAADAALLILKQNPVKPENIKTVIVRLPTDGAAVVNDRHMPDINLQYIMAVLLLDGQLTFEAAHNLERMKNEKVLQMKSRVELVPDEELMRSSIPRQGIVEIITHEGQTFREHVRSVRGTPQNPMTAEDVEEKALDLLRPGQGPERAQKIIEKVRELESLATLRELAALLRKA